MSKVDVPGLSVLSHISHSDSVAAQHKDPALQAIFTAVMPHEELESVVNGYFMQDELRKWIHQNEDSGSGAIIQVERLINLRNGY